MREDLAHHGRILHRGAEPQPAGAPAPRRGFVEEIVEMVANCGIEHAVLGVTGPIRGLGSGTRLKTASREPRP